MRKYFRARTELKLHAVVREMKIIGQGDVLFSIIFIANISMCALLVVLYSYILLSSHNMLEF